MLLRTMDITAGRLTLDDVQAVFDLDGVLADSSWRNERDVGLCMRDPVINRDLIVDNEYRKVIFLTGREDSYFLETRGWIDNVLQAVLPWELDYLLLMRPTGNQMETGAMKVAVLEAAFNSSYLEFGLNRATLPFPLYDDNPKVIKAYRDLGWDGVQISWRVGWQNEISTATRD